VSGATFERTYPAVVAGALAVAAYWQAGGVASLVASRLHAAPSSSVAVSRPAGPAAQASPRELTASAILARNPFDSATGPIGPPKPSAPPPPVPVAVEPEPGGEAALPPKCTTGVPVLISEADEPALSFALVKTGADKRMVKLGDAVDGRTVESIGWDHVILAAGTERCSLRMHDVERAATTSDDAPVVRPMPASESAPAPASSSAATTNADIVKVSDTEYVIERGGADAMTAMQQAFMKSARVVDGKGIRLFKAAQSTVLGQLGLKRGDTVETINGLAMSEPDKAIEAYGRLKTSRTVTLGVERGGKDVTITITIK
jgi:general secretion pathway protein C